MLLHKKLILLLAAAISLSMTLKLPEFPGAKEVKETRESNSSKKLKSLDELFSKLPEELWQDGISPFL